MHLEKGELRAPPAKNPVSSRIVAVARHHFLAHGFRGVTMDDLAEQLGMSKKTLYTHFPSKAVLLEAMLLDKFRGIEADLEQITSECSSDFHHALHQLLACVQRHAEEIQPPFIRDLQREAPEMFQWVEDRRRNLIRRYFGKFFSEGRKAGVIRKDIPAELVIEILLGALQAVMNPSKMTELGLTPKAAYTAIIRVIFEGVITTAPRSKR